MNARTFVLLGTTACMMLALAASAGAQVGPVGGGPMIKPLTTPVLRSEGLTELLPPLSFQAYGNASGGAVIARDAAANTPPAGAGTTSIALPNPNGAGTVTVPVTVVQTGDFNFGNASFNNPSGVRQGDTVVVTPNGQHYVLDHGTVVGTVDVNPPNAANPFAPAFNHFQPVDVPVQVQVGTSPGGVPLVTPGIPVGPYTATIDWGAGGPPAPTPGGGGGIAIVGDGVSTAVWDITTGSGASLNTYSIPVFTNFSGGPTTGTTPLPPLFGTPTGSGTIPPFNPTGGNSGTQIPLNFGNVPNGPTLFVPLSLGGASATQASGGGLLTTPTTSLSGSSLSLLQTTLLFPFVTNQLGFDTGLAISNTSTDPFGTTMQSGTCSLNFYSCGAPQPGSPPSTGTIPTGSADSTAGFQGYIIATTNFSNGGSFGFINGGVGDNTFGLNPNSLALGYLNAVLAQTGLPGGGVSLGGSSGGGGGGGGTGGFLIPAGANNTDTFGLPVGVSIFIFPGTSVPYQTNVTVFGGAVPQTFVAGTSQQPLGTGATLSQIQSGGGSNEFLQIMFPSAGSIGTGIKVTETATTAMPLPVSFSTGVAFYTGAMGLDGSGNLVGGTFQGETSSSLTAPSANNFTLGVTTNGSNFMSNTFDGNQPAGQGNSRPAVARAAHVAAQHVAAAPTIRH